MSPKKSLPLKRNSGYIKIKFKSCLSFSFRTLVNTFYYYSCCSLILFILLYETGGPFPALLRPVTGWTLPDAEALIAAYAGHEQIELRFEVLENVPIGTLIGTIRANDSEKDILAQPPYLIVPIAGTPNQLPNHSGQGPPAYSSSPSQPDSSTHGRERNTRGVDSDLNIDQSTGEIRSAVVLDREQTAFYSFIVIPLSGANIRVTIVVLDTNDNAPRFPVEVIYLEFPENSRPEVKRTLPAARDEDLGQFGTQTYRVVSGNNGSAFRLNSHREKDNVLYLDLQVNGVLDRETVPSYTLVIEALDGGLPPLRGELVVNITILDVNDNEPVFSQSRYYGTVPENATLGTSLLRVSATDADQNENGQVTLYSKVPTGPGPGSASTYFAINKDTGWIYVARPLDFESKDVHELVVVAKDSGVQPLETSAFVSILVTDVNDNQPTISVLFLTENSEPVIPETARIGDLVARVSVNDPDSGDNRPPSQGGSSSSSSSDLTVALTGSEGHFGLRTTDSIVYLVVVTAPLNRQTRNMYNLTITATDKGQPPLKASSSFQLQVGDINDNPPRVRSRGKTSSKRHELHIMESSRVGSEVGVISINSENMTVSNDCLNGYFVQYPTRVDSAHPFPFLVDSSDRFKLMLVLSSPLDFEQENEYDFSLFIDYQQCAALVSYDSHLASPLHKSYRHQALVKVLVGDDISDCHPFARISADLQERESPILEIEVEIEVPVNETGTTIHQKPVDIYHFSKASSPGCSQLSINYRVVSPFHGQDDLHKLFAVSDGGSLLLRPFDKDLVAAFLRRKELILVVEALFSPTGEGPGLGPGPGPGKAEAHAVGGSKVLGSISVKVKHVKESGRRVEEVGFVNDPFLELEEDCCSVGETVMMLRINVSQGDFITRYHLNLEMDKGSDRSELTVDPGTGFLSLLRPFDFEKRRDYKFNATAAIYLRSSSAASPSSSSSTSRSSRTAPVLSPTPVKIVTQTVTIKILNVNDEPPKVLQTEYRKDVPENMLPNSFLLKVEAVDPDGDRNLTFLIPDGHPAGDLFALDSLSGELRTKAPLDREVQETHRIPVFVFDDNFKHKAQTEVIIKLLDINDNPPTFNINNQVVKIPENILPGTIFHTVVAVDKDLLVSPDPGSPLGPGLRYRIVSGNTGNKFALNTQRGHISTTGALDRERQPIFQLIIEATDSLFTATSNLTIELLDVNDNAPIFDRNVYYAVIDGVYGTEKGNGLESVKEVVSVKALDPDADDKVYYTINATTTSDAMYFNIDSSTGLITTSTAALTRAQQSKFSSKRGLLSSNSSRSSSRATTTFTFDVLAIDVGSSSYAVHSSNATVHVTVMNSLTFESPRLKSYPYILELDSLNTDFNVGSQVGSIELEEGPISESSQGVVTFKVVEDNNGNRFSDFFTIDSKTGAIIVKRALNSNLYECYLQVERTETSTTTTSLVQILFLKGIPSEMKSRKANALTFRVEVSENLPVKSHIANLVSRSRMPSLQSGQHRFELTYSSVDPNYFDLQPNTGIIYLRKRLDYETDPPIIELAIVAKKTGNPFESPVHFNLVLSLLNLNDNPPKFTQHHYIATVREGESKGTFVTQISALDMDDVRLLVGNQPEYEQDMSRKRNSLTYHIFEGNHDNAFMIDPPGSGILKSNIVLDREIRDRYLLKIVANDEGETLENGGTAQGSKYQLSSHCTLEINILDVNDNVPVFPPYQEINVSEDTEIGSIVSTLTANDVDNYPSLTYYKQRGSNGHFDETDDIFDIGLYTGKITLKSSLASDRPGDGGSGQQGSKEYNLHILASDSLHTVETQVVIKVRDGNVMGKAPVLAKDLMYIDVDPNQNDCIASGTVNCPLTQVSTILTNNNQTDRSWTNGLKVSFRLKYDESQSFYVDYNTGIIYNNRSLHHVHKLHQLTVLAGYSREGGRFINGKRSKASVLINVLGSDPSVDLLPSDENGFNLNVSANKVGVVLMRLPLNSKYKYKIVGGNDGTCFAIMRKSELVKVKRTVASEYKLEIEGKRSKSSDTITLMVNIKVTGEGETSYSSAFRSQVFTIRLKESEPVGKEVISLRPEDHFRHQYKYRIFSGNEANHFRVQESSGSLLVNQELDYESKASYHLTVTASKSDGSEVSVAVININLINVNDNLPKFPLSLYKTIVDENLPIGTKVIKISALDGDNSGLEYSLIRTIDGLAPFVLDPVSGYLVTTQVLDYETSTDTFPPVHKLVLKAFDVSSTQMPVGSQETTATPSKSSSTEVLVEILVGSVDEFPPKFTSESFDFTISTYIGLPFVKIGQVVATDSDSGPDGMVKYSLRSSSPASALNKFTVNPNTGLLSLSTLMADDIPPKHSSLIVSASSGREDSLSSLAVIEVTLNLLDGNAINSVYGENVVRAEDPSSSSSSSTSGATSTSIPGWILFLVVLLMLITVVLLVIIVVIRLHQQQGGSMMSTPGSGHFALGMSTLLRKFGQTPSNMTMDMAPDNDPTYGAPGLHHHHHHHHGGYLVSATATAPPVAPPGYNEVTLSSPNVGEGHSASSGRGSAEDEDDVDEEIRMINEGNDFYGERLDHDHCLDLEQSVPTTAEYLARLGVIDNVQDLVPETEEEADEEDDILSEDLGHSFPIVRPSRMFSSVRSQRERKGRRHGPGQRELEEWPSMCSIALNPTLGVLHSEEELNGAYHWDYLQNWGPKYTPLTSVFAEIARLKGNQPKDNESVAGSGSVTGHNNLITTEYIHGNEDETASVISSSTSSSRHLHHHPNHRHHNHRHSHHSYQSYNNSLTSPLVLINNQLSPSISSAFSPVVTSSGGGMSSNQQQLLNNQHYHHQQHLTLSNPLQFHHQQQHQQQQHHCCGSSTGSGTTVIPENGLN